MGVVRIAVILLRAVLLPRAALDAPTPLLIRTLTAIRDVDLTNFAGFQSAFTGS